MEKKFLGQRIKRNEDPRILTGRAKYIADINYYNVLQAAFFEK